MWHVESSSLTRDRTWAPALGVQSLSHWTTREVSRHRVHVKHLIQGQASVRGSQRLCSPRRDPVTLRRSLLTLCLVFSICKTQHCPHVSSPCPQSFKGNHHPVSSSPLLSKCWQLSPPRQLNQWILDGQQQAWTTWVSYFNFVALNGTWHLEIDSKPQRTSLSSALRQVVPTLGKLGQGFCDVFTPWHSTEAALGPSGPLGITVYQESDRPHDDVKMWFYPSWDVKN